MEYTTIKIDKITKERIVKYSRNLKMTQGNFLSYILEIAEKNNFQKEVGIDLIKKNISEDNNRIIGFIKTNDKSVNQVNKNLETVLNTIEKSSERRHEDLTDKINKIFKVLLLKN